VFIKEKKTILRQFDGCSTKVRGVERPQRGSVDTDSEVQCRHGHLMGSWRGVCGSTRTDPTRTRGYGSGQVDVSRVGSGTGTTSAGTGLPGFTRKGHDFSRFWSENLFIFACFQNYLRWSNCSMARENSILL